MDLGFIAQYLLNGIVLGVIYAMVAVGFTLFFGVLDVIKFSHGDVVMAGAFTALATYAGLQQIGLGDSIFLAIVITVAGIIAMGALGAVLAKFLILPLRHSPPLNTLLITLMFGLALRESVRLFYPNGSNPKPFPQLLPDIAFSLGNLELRLDSVLLIVVGLGAIIGVHLLIERTKVGLAIRAVAQDPETARLMGINFERVVLATFALGSGLAALAGVSNGLYYSEVNFGMGLLLGVIGFSAAVVGGLGSLYGAIIGGFLFAALQTIGAVWFSVPAYKDVFAFACIIVLMAWKPTGLLAAKSSERV
jgi:branched-chain amino acid transport system permease protein